MAELVHPAMAHVAFSTIPVDFRGPATRALAEHIADKDGFIDAAAIGRSARDIPFTPPSPSGDTQDSPLQLHKYVWHCLLRFGTAVEDL